MLYLEDFIDLIENIPSQVRDMLFEIRELDLQAQNDQDSLGEKSREFFRRCLESPMVRQQRDDEMTQLRGGYARVLELCDEKVDLADKIYELLDRSVRELDKELNKFRLELEADNAGVTELLETRAATEGFPGLAAPGLKTDKRRQGSYADVFEPLGHRPRAFGHLGTLRTLNSIQVDNDSMYGDDCDLLQRAFSTGSFRDCALPSPAALLDMSTDPSLLGDSQRSSGRRAMKINYESLAKGLYDRPHGHKRQKRDALAERAMPVALKADAADAPDASDNDEPSDPNEPRYCICNDVSYGEMVACDNADCPVEWFHYGCVGLTHAPKGKWFCNQCTTSIKRRQKKT